MPFIISTSYRQAVNKDALVVNAGEDQNLICATTGFLEAVVIGDLTGRTLTWEQVSGSPVSFNGPVDQLSVSFTQFNFDDKVFRFTIDKNLPSESFDEINVFGTPTFSANLPVSQSVKTVRMVIAVPSVVMSASPITQPVTNVQCGGFDEPEISWTPPATQNTVNGYAIEFSTDGGKTWSTEATVSPNTRRYTPLYNNLASIYRVLAIYSTPNATFTGASRSLDRTIVANGKTVVTEWVTFPANTPTATSTLQMRVFDVETLKLVTKTGGIDDSFLGRSKSNTSTMRVFDVETLKLVTKTGGIDDATPAIEQASKTSTMRTFSVLNLTGGSVGG